MKKIMLAIVFAIGSVFHAFAAIGETGYESQLRLSIDEGLYPYTNLGLGVDYVGGYRFNNIVRLGAGVGVNYMSLRYQEPFLNLYGSYVGGYSEGSVTIPLFLDLKVNFTRTSFVSPFFSAAGGYTFFVPCSEFAKHNKLGFFAQPAFGLDFRFGVCTVSVEIAYKYQQRVADNAYYGARLNGGNHNLVETIAISF